MTPEQQAQKLAEWLDSHPGTEPPAGLDPEVIEAVYALRPDLAPAPRISADDILAAVTSGPLAPGWQGDEPVADDGPEGAVVPFPVAQPAAKPVRWRRWAFGAGAGSLVAMAAAALLVVRVFTGASEPSEPAMQVTMSPGARLEMAPAEEPAAVEDEPAVAGLEEEDFVDDFAADLPADPSAGADRGSSLGATGVAGDSRFRTTTDAPPPASKPVAYEPVAGAPEDVMEQPTGIAAGSEVALDLAKPTARPSPSPAPLILPTSPGQIDATPPPTVAGRAPVATATVQREAEHGPAVADADDLDERQTGTRRDQGYAEGAGSTAVPKPVEASDETVALESRGSGWSPFGRDRSRNEPQIESERHEEPERKGKDRLDGGLAASTGEAASTDDGEYGQFAADNTADLDSLRARAVPSDLPAAELLARTGTSANEDANVYVAQGRYNDAGNALLPTVTLPAPQGSTNAAQAATWFIEGGDLALARTAAEAGLANTSGNTPERSWLWVLYGDSLRQAGDPNGAARAYGEAVLLNDARVGDVRADPPVPASAPR